MRLKYNNIICLVLYNTGAPTNAASNVVKEKLL
jgi:hypothetical protein